MNITVISGNIPGAIADLHKEQELVAGTGFRLVFAQDAKAYGLSKRVLVALLAPGCSAEGIVQATRRLSTAGRLRVADHLINIPTVAFLLLLFGTLSAFGNAFYDLSKDILTAESSLGLSFPSWPSQSVALALLFLALLLPLGMFSRAAISGDIGSVTNTVANLFRRLFVPPTSRDIIATRIFRLLSKSRNVPSELRIICAFSASQEGRNDREIIDGLLHAAGKADIDARLYVPE
ncbi:MAG: hypothetical protein QG616_2171, partial [Pseudomonadota bacterium]|nr:hypothetical protein [Pseudomonadota bacterium]